MPGRTDPLILAFLLAIAAVPTGAAEFLGAFRWDRPTDTHGGYSGLEVSEDGSRFTALSDRSTLVSGRILRDGDTIADVSVETETRLKNRKGRAMTGPFGDSEGLVVAPDGTLFVAFEHFPRVWRYDGPDSLPTPLPRHPDFDLLAENGALEALAMEADGTLWTLPERSPGGLPVPVWRRAGGAWSSAFTLRPDGYAAVGADFDDTGRLYLLERRFGGIGFATRVRRLTLAGGGPVRDEVLIETPLRRHDNLEGLAVWRDAAGALRLTMISDDNFNWFQRTEIVEYRIAD